MLSTSFLLTLAAFAAHTLAFPYDLDRYKYQLQSVVEPASMADMVLPWGYPLEEHTIETEDGYILTVYRIPYGRNETKSSKPRPPLLLQHGVLCSSACWVLSDPDKGLGFVLADAGYDVWMGNSRGSTYSRKHKTLDPEQSSDKQKYWNFSFHEMGYYDLPAVIDYMLKHTAQKQVFYVGHSQGTTQFFAMAAAKPEYNDKIKVSSHLAPIAFLDHTRGTVRVLCAFSKVLSWVAEHLGIYEVLSNSFILHLLDASVCRQTAVTRPLCDNLLFLIAGYDSQQLNITLVPAIADHCPAGASTKQLIHFGQLATNGEKFRQFDYGSDNQKIYGLSDPPDYDLSKIKSPVVLHYADNDWLSGTQDVAKLYDGLPEGNKQKREVPFAYFNHLDFMWAIDVRPLLYDPMIEIMSKY
uniref:Lipase n=1 Tax=Pristhesancus plagipennis TaxID=1955184 RepID=A0A2K8JM46_PRIPG|nr:secreted Esterase/lipase protein [Pristhesancus plagipennis]